MSRRIYSKVLPLPFNDTKVRIIYEKTKLFQLKNLNWEKKKLSCASFSDRQDKKKIEMFVS